MREREVKLEVGSFAFSPRYSILDDTVVTALPRREIVTEYAGAGSGIPTITGWSAGDARCDFAGDAG